MRIILFLLLAISFTSCKEEQKKLFNIEQEPLSSRAEFKTASWNGYNDFVFELKTLTENFSKKYAMEKSRNLLSKSHAILYSMPSDLRNEITNEKATDLVEAAKEFNDSITSKTDDEIKEGLKRIISSYTILNKEINYMVKSD